MKMCLVFNVLLFEKHKKKKKTKLIFFMFSITIFKNMNQIGLLYFLYFLEQKNYESNKFSLFFLFLKTKNSFKKL